MGTSCLTGSYRNVKDFMLQFLIKNFKAEWGENFKLVDYAISGNFLYLLVYSADRNYNFITVTKCSKQKNEFCYKFMEDNMQPYFYDCPERLLKQANSTNEYAQKWYADCREYREMKKERKTIIETLSTTVNAAGIILEDLMQRKIKFNYVRNNTFFIGESIEDGKTYRWKWDYIPIEQLRNLINPKAA